MLLHEKKVTVGERGGARRRVEGEQGLEGGAGARRGSRGSNKGLRLLTDPQEGSGVSCQAIGRRAGTVDPHHISLNTRH